MPCFKESAHWGLAVSIHTPDGPLPEYSIQKNGRASRISSYIPVPQPQLDVETGRTEPSSFAISITLLVPSQPVPYSRPATTLGSSVPQPKLVGSLSGSEGERGKFTGVIGPYIPLTTGPNETVAAYIHFDGRAKEEVATLLRRGEETWVNSRWVSVPGTEGGGLAEREFLFREVGLERWLNGLDLKGETKEVAARVERRKRRLEKKRRKKLERDDNSEDDSDSVFKRTTKPKGGVLRYGDDKEAPIQTLSDDDSIASSDTDSEDEIPVPEAAGQIKVSLFRVLASGEVKKGEYSPQFEAHDDDETTDGNQGGDSSADVDHTTTFAKPKSLDPKTISTQTVTGLDPPSKPYAVFVFFYRGKKQLQKMGILQDLQMSAAGPEGGKKKMGKQLDASSLKPLKSTQGTVGFTGYRDANAKSAFSKDTSTKGDLDSEDDEGDPTQDKARNHKANGARHGKAEDEPVEEDRHTTFLSPEEVSKRGELAESVKKMHLKRQHSFETSEPGPAPASKPEPSPQNGGIHNVSNQTTTTPPSTAITEGDSGGPKPAQLSKLNGLATGVGSPFKKQRPSLDTGNEPIVGSSKVASFASVNEPNLFGTELSAEDAVDRTDDTKGPDITSTPPPPNFESISPSKADEDPKL